MAASAFGQQVMSVKPEKVDGINEWDCTGPAPYGWPEYFGFTAEQVMHADAVHRLHAHKTYAFRLTKVRVMFMGADVPYVVRAYDIDVHAQPVLEAQHFFVKLDVFFEGKLMPTERETRRAVHEIIFAEKAPRALTTFAAPRNSGLVVLLSGGLEE